MIECKICLLEHPKHKLFRNRCCDIDICTDCAGKCDNKCPGCRTIWAPDSTETETVPFVPTDEQKLTFDFELLYRESVAYDPDSLQSYVDNHFFVCKGYVYMWAGDRVDDHHKFFKGGKTMSQTVKWFCGTDKAPNFRMNSWASYIEKCPARSTTVKSLHYDISNVCLTDDELSVIRPILDYDENMCACDKAQTHRYHQILGMKLKFPDDPVKHIGDKFLAIIGPEGNGKSTWIPLLSDCVFGSGQYRQVSLRDFSTPAVYAKVAPYCNTILDDSFGAKLTHSQTSTIRCRERL